jgi:hypothetical protein
MKKRRRENRSRTRKENKYYSHSSEIDVPRYPMSFMFFNVGLLIYDSNLSWMEAFK